MKVKNFQTGGITVYIPNNFIAFAITLLVTFWRYRTTPHAIPRPGHSFRNACFREFPLSAVASRTELNFRSKITHSILLKSLSLLLCILLVTCTLKQLGRFLESIYALMISSVVVFMTIILCPYGWKSIDFPSVGVDYLVLSSTKLFMKMLRSKLF